ncbi:MAG TPA: hypothetical protein V6C97_04825 [Oculatellaceae cyanobacterium]
MRRDLLAATLLSTLFCATAADAKLGEEIDKYKQRVAKAYTLKNQATKDGKTNYSFVINSDPTLAKAAPGFGGGVTITVEHGKITGQSMVLRLGQNSDVGKEIAVRFALDFAFEALGRAVPKTKKELSDEVNSYRTVINSALAGAPQNVRYPKLTGKITVSKTADGSLVLAATPG